MSTLYTSLITALSALLTPTIAAGAAYIAWQNMKTAKHKIKIDLFDKRMRVVNEIKDLIDRMYNKNVMVAGDPYVKFVEVMKEADWLFPPAVNVWVALHIGENIKDIALKWGEIDVIDAFDKEKRSPLVKELRAVKAKLVEADHQFRDQFKPYLQLHEL